MAWWMKYLVVALLFACCDAAAQKPCVVMFYNVENLMDTANDAVTYDDTMLPNADREWSEERYRHKLSSVACVVSDVARLHDYPSLLALAEVENSVVLEDLIGENVIATADYKYIHYDSPDERGIDVALLYRPDKFVEERSCAVRANVEPATRDYLMVWGKLCGEPVLVVVVHFTSRIGGVKFTSASRERCATQVRQLIDDALKAEPQRTVIVMGDMNDNPRNRTIKHNLRSVGRPKRVTGGTLFNPFYRTRGSYNYREHWYQYDQILLSADIFGGGGLSLVKNRGTYGSVFSVDYMVDRRGRPQPTYRATDYVGGVSDHLPVYVLLKKKSQKSFVVK